MGITGKEIVLAWLKQREESFDYLTIQTELPSFGRTNYGVYHTPDSYTRYFRFVKNLVQLKEVEGKWKTWQTELTLF